MSDNQLTQLRDAAERWRDCECTDDATEDVICSACWDAAHRMSAHILATVQADAWVPRPLAWVQTGIDEWAAGGFVVRRYRTKWELYVFHGAMPETCESLADGQAKAEAWHIMRITAFLTKVVAS